MVIQVLPFIVKLQIICKSMHSLALTVMIGWLDWAGTNEGTRRKRAGIRRSLVDIGHTL